MTDRVWQHVNSERPIAIITAFRGEFDKEQNIRRNKELASNIRKSGMGFFYVDGYWIENQGTPEEIKVSEDSIFVIGTEGKDKEFKQLIIDFGKQYNQDGVLVKTIDGINIYDKNGKSVYTMKTLNPNKISDVYTKLRNNKKSNTFVFESERDDSGWINRLMKI